MTINYSDHRELTVYQIEGTTFRSTTNIYGAHHINLNLSLKLFLMHFSFLINPSHLVQ